MKEPSSWAGVSVLLGVFGVQIAPEIMQNVVSVGAGVAGLASIFMSESN